MKAALKEWAVAVDALTRGETILLLRKGGIREQQGRFKIAERQIWLYPTYEHQQSELLKAPYDQQVQPVPSGWHPESISLKAWADITHVFQMNDQASVQALLPFHIWNERFVSDRLRWKPSQPLYGLLLRVHRLKAAQTIPYRAEYGGCKSWIDLSIAPAFPGVEPVLADESYAERVNQIQSIVQS